MDGALYTADGQTVTYTGRLIHTAEARCDIARGTLRTVPILCLQIELDNSHHNILRVEQPFRSDQFAQCWMAARRLKEGMRVTVQAPLQDLRLLARNADHIHIIRDDAPTTNTTEQNHAQNHYHTV